MLSQFSISWVVDLFKYRYEPLTINPLPNFRGLAHGLNEDAVCLRNLMHIEIGLCFKEANEYTKVCVRNTVLWLRVHSGNNPCVRLHSNCK